MQTFVITIASFDNFANFANFATRSGSITLEEIDQKAFEGLQRGDERFEKTEGARRLSSRFDPTAQAVRQARCFGSDSAAWQ